MPEINNKFWKQRGKDYAKGGLRCDLPNKHKWKYEENYDACLEGYNEQKLVNLIAGIPTKNTHEN